MPYLIISRILALIGSIAFGVALWCVFQQLPSHQIEDLWFPFVIGVLALGAFFMMDRMIIVREDTFSRVGLTVLIGAMALVCVFLAQEMWHWRVDASIEGRYFPGKIITEMLFLFIQGFFLIFAPLFVTFMLWGGVLLGAVWVWIGNKLLARSMRTEA